jgi:Zn-dependent protease with chaperone function
MSTMTTGSPAAHHTPSGSRSGPPTIRKVASLLAIAAGVVLLASTFINNLFAVGPAFEDMIDDFRPVLTQESIDTAKSDVASLGAVSQEFSGSMAPAVAEQLGMTPEQFSAMVQEQFPAVNDGMTAIPEVATTFDGLLTTLETQQPLFESADAIPTQDLPATTVPWMMLIAGLLSLGVGILLWFSAKTGAVLAIVLGAALIVVPLVLSLPQKAADADQLNENLKPVYTQQLVDQAGTALATMGAMGEEMQSTMIPALAEQLGMTPEELQTFLGDNFPAVAGALQNLPDTMARFQGLVTVFDENLDNYQTITEVSFVPIIWTLIGAGGVVLLAGLLALAGGRREVETV